MSLIAKELGKGADPDESFYIQNADKAPHKKTLFDHKKDTPPDLVIEVDESIKSEEKFVIYAAFGIKEFWRFDKNALKIYALDDFGIYCQTDKSISLPILTGELLNEFVNRGLKGDQFETLLEFENRLREISE